MKSSTKSKDTKKPAAKSVNRIASATRTTKDAKATKKPVKYDRAALLKDIGTIPLAKQVLLEVA